MSLPLAAGLASPGVDPDLIDKIRGLDQKTDRLLTIIEAQIEALARYSDEQRHRTLVPINFCSPFLQGVGFPGKTTQQFQYELRCSHFWVAAAADEGDLFYCSIGGNSRNFAFGADRTGMEYQLPIIIGGGQDITFVANNGSNFVLTLWAYPE